MTSIVTLEKPILDWTFPHLFVIKVDTNRIDINNIVYRLQRYIQVQNFETDIQNNRTPSMYEYTSTVFSIVQRKIYVNYEYMKYRNVLCTEIRVMYLNFLLE